MTDELTELPTKLNPLPEEVRTEKRAKLKARKEFAQVFSHFVKTMRATMTDYLHFRSKGVTREDGITGIEHVLREVWPKSVSKFSAECDACDDTGFQEDICRPYARCGGKYCERKGEEHQHRFVRFCFCPKGEQFRRSDSRKHQPEEAVMQIGKTSKPKKSWQRLGT